MSVAATESNDPTLQLTMDHVWVYLTRDEAYELLESLKVWAEEVEQGCPDTGWHTHVTDTAREFTLAINDQEGRGRFADRFAKSS
jgi:hypothetical protein